MACGSRLSGLVGTRLRRIDRHDPISVRIVLRRSLKRLEVGWHQHEAQLQRPKIVDLPLGPLIDRRRRDSESACERGGIAVVSGNGFLGARIPMMEPHAGVLAVARLSVEFGHTLEAITNVLADGRICPKDIPELRRALDEIGQLEAELVTAKRYVSGHLQDLAPRAVQGGHR